MDQLPAGMSPYKVIYLESYLQTATKDNIVSGGYYSIIGNNLLGVVYWYVGGLH